MRAVRHAVAVGLYATLGLLTKFVAVRVPAADSWCSDRRPFAAAREKVLRAWRPGLGVALGVLVLARRGLRTWDGSWARTSGRRSRPAGLPAVH
jgi:hypothetical protein